MDTINTLLDQRFVLEMTVAGKSGRDSIVVKGSDFWDAKAMKRLLDRSAKDKSTLYRMTRLM